MLTKIYKLKTRKNIHSSKPYTFTCMKRLTEVLTNPDYENRAMHMERKIPCAGFPRCTHTNPLGTSWDLFVIHIQDNREIASN